MERGEGAYSNGVVLQSPSRGTGVGRDDYHRRWSDHCGSATDGGSFEITRHTEAVGTTVRHSDSTLQGSPGRGNRHGESGTHVVFLKDKTCILVFVDNTSEQQSFCPGKLESIQLEAGGHVLPCLEEHDVSLPKRESAHYSIPTVDVFEGRIS